MTWQSDHSSIAVIPKPSSAGHDKRNTSRHSEREPTRQQMAARIAKRLRELGCLPRQIELHLAQIATPEMLERDKREGRLAAHHAKVKVTDRLRAHYRKHGLAAAKAIADEAVADGIVSSQFVKQWFATHTR